MSEIMDRINAFMETLPDPATVPASMEVGQEAWNVIRLAATRPDQLTEGGWGMAGFALFGTPVHIKPLPGGPRAWRLLNSAGDVLREGVIR